MKTCDQCEAPVPAYDIHCPRCGGMLMRGPDAPASRSWSRLFKVLKWLFIGLAVAAALAGVTVLLILNSLGPMPSFG